MVDFLRRLTFKTATVICRMFFGSFSAVFGSFSGRFRLVSDRFRIVLHGFHSVFFVLLASSRHRFRCFCHICRHCCRRLRRRRYHCRHRRYGRMAFRCLYGSTVDCILPSICIKPTKVIAPSQVLANWIFSLPYPVNLNGVS